MATEIREAPAEERGLTSAEVKQRIELGQVNEIQEGPSRTTAQIVRDNVVTRFNILLGVLLLVILVAVREPRDALFGIVLVTNAAIGIIQELRAKATLDRLSVLTSPTIRVVRDGQVQSIDIYQVVKDDLLEIRTGDQLPVDGIVTSSRGLEIDESLLTGESEPIAKEPGDRALSGSFVNAGTGRFRAQRVGADSYAARLAIEARKFTLVRSELRDGIDWILGALSWIIGPIILLLVWSQMNAGFGFLESLRSAVAGAVGMVPQGLVLLTSIAFAVGVVRLGKKNVLVQELPAIEGLARVDVVAFDKTGTLTEGSLAVYDLEVYGEQTEVEAALGALAAAEPDPNGTMIAIKNAYPAPEGWVADDTVPFSSARKWSAASFAARGTWVLGAPDIVAPNDRVVAGTVQSHTSRGRRVVLLARTSFQLARDQLPRSLEPVAVVILGDRIRSDAPETLRYFADQGVKAKVISGDHPRTVAAISAEAGVPGSYHVVDAADLPEDPVELMDVSEQATVFGRVAPHHKRRILNALQARGHDVAMTGDGVNDVLALKDADIGVAMGSGSPAARAVAQLVLIDGKFSTLPGVVAEGRRVIFNIERVANVFVTKTVYAVLIAIATAIAGLPFPFLPRHLTLVGSVTIGIPAFFLALAPTARRARPGFVKRVLSFAIPTGIAAGIATYAAYELALSEDVSLTEARTTATIVLAALGLFALGIVMRPVVGWKRTLMGGMIALLLLLLFLPVSQDFFELEIPDPVVLLAAVGIVAITGAVMIGTLRAVGWARQVPEYLRQTTTEPEQTWERIRQAFMDSPIPSWYERLIQRPEGEATAPAPADESPVEHPAAEPATEAAPEPDEEPPPQPESEEAEPTPAPTPPRGEIDPLSDVEWFDPDKDF